MFIYILIYLFFFFFIFFSDVSEPIATPATAASRGKLEQGNSLSAGVGKLNVHYVYNSIYVYDYNKINC
ncbi:MAG: hypothetical protein AAFY30_16825, partial [Cyanobacteria bacterium J06642_12]